MGTLNRIRYGAIFVLAFLLFLLLISGPAQANHGVAQCGGFGMKSCISASASPLIKNAVRHGVVTYCFNLRASSYPQFRQQIGNVMRDEGAKLGFIPVEVPYSTQGAGCNVQHDMPETHGCGGCAAWVYTHNWPVKVEYQWQLGYVRWDSTGGHEMGHATCLLDEHYDKANFRSWILTYGYWREGVPTVMDVGTPYLAEYSPLGIWYLTDYDVSRCRETIYPKPIDGWGLRYHADGTPFVFACNVGTVSGPADRLALMAIAPDGAMYWTGIHLPAPGNCATGGAVGINITGDPGWCYALNPELSTMSATWDLYRQDRIVGCL